jgi:uncharacterized membrane protein YgcG
MVRKESKKLQIRHSGESRNPVISLSSMFTGPRLSPGRRLLTCSSWFIFTLAFFCTLHWLRPEAAQWLSEAFSMKKIVAILILLSFSTPVHARMIMKQDPIESELVTQPQPEERKPVIAPKPDTADQRKKQLEEDMSREYQKGNEPQKPVVAKEQDSTEKKGSNWWKWALGIAVVGGIAAAAGGGGGGGDSGGSGGNSGTGNIGASW